MDRHYYSHFTTEKGFFKALITHIETLIRSYSTSRNKVPVRAEQSSSCFPGEKWETKKRSPRQSLVFPQGSAGFPISYQWGDECIGRCRAWVLILQNTHGSRDRGQGQGRRSLAHPPPSATNRPAETMWDEEVGSVDFLPPPPRAQPSPEVRKVVKGQRPQRDWPRGSEPVLAARKEGTWGVTSGSG